MGQKHKPFREFRTPFPLRDIRENPRSNVRACAASDGAICSKNRKIVPYHGANPNTRNGARLRSPSGRLYVGRWNERVRAKRCDAVDWGLLKSLRRFYLLTLELWFLKKLHETPFYVNQQLFWCIFCSEAIAKGEFFWDESRTSNFALWMSNIFSR